MPLIKITDERGEQVWQGEGELVRERSGFLDRTVIRQTVRTATERRSRDLDLSGFLTVFPADVAVEFDIPPLRWTEPTAEEMAQVPDLPGVKEIILRIQAPGSALSFIAQALDAPIETDDERRAREVARTEEMRRMHEEQVRLFQDARYSSEWHAERTAFTGGPIDFRDVLPSRDEMRETFSGGPIEARDGYGIAPRSEWSSEYQGLFRAAFQEAGVSLDQYRYDADALMQGRDRLYESAVRDAETLRALNDLAEQHEEAIRSTKAEFPYDRYDYGRINPEGPSRWTPPDDPDEKVSRCP